MIRPYLRDLINDHKATVELNDDTDRAEWKVQLTMQNSCISTKSFEETCTIYTKNEPVEIFMGSNTEDVIDKPFNTLSIHYKISMRERNIK